MLTNEQAAELRSRGIEWWRSDEAFDHRCGQYLALMLLSNPENRRAEWGKSYPEPEWPAVYVYDMVTDQPFWVECKIRTHLKDYMRTCRPIDINAAALRIAKAN